MSKLILISSFIGKRRGKNRFNFNGYLKRERVISIEIINGTFKKGKEYIIYLDPDYVVKDEILTASSIKAKQLGN